MTNTGSKKGSAKGHGYIFQQRPGGNYYLQYIVNGKRKTESLKVKHKKDKVKNGEVIEKGAETKAREILEPALTAHSKEKVQLNIAESRKLIKRSKILIGDAWDQFVNSKERPPSGDHTLKQYESKWEKNFIPWLQENYPRIKFLTEVDDEVATSFADYIWDEGISERTYNGYLQALRLIMRTLSKKAGITENPFLNIANKKENKQSRKEFTSQQVLDLMEAFDDPKLEIMHKDEMYVMFNIGCWTGARAHDAATMTWENINWKKKTISFQPKKTAKRTEKYVSIPMHPMLEESLRKAESWKKNEYILPEIAHRYSYNPGGVGKDVMKVFTHIGLVTSKKSTARRKLQQNVYSFHSFRHSFVSFCANSGVPLSVVQDIVGHGNPSMTRHYTHISKEAAKDAVKSLPLNDGAPDPLKEELKAYIEEADNEVLEKIKEFIAATPGSA